MIRYANGQKAMISDKSDVAPTPKQQPQSVASAMSEVSEEHNKDLMRDYKIIGVKYINDKQKKKGGTAKRTYCQLLFDEDSKLCDDNIEIDYSIGRILYEWVDKRITSKNLDVKVAGFEDERCPLGDPALKMSIKNKTNKTVYIVWAVVISCAKERLKSSIHLQQHPRQMLLPQDSESTSVA